jgi:hypothetical protein
MKLTPALATICALALPCALLADTFEGKIGISMTSPSAQGPQTLNVSVKEGLARFDIESARGSMAMIRDTKNKQMIILMPQQRMYMVHPLEQPGQMPQTGQMAQQGAPAASQSTLKETGVKETILGYVCTKYIVTGPTAPRRYGSRTSSERSWGSRRRAGRWGGRRRRPARGSPPSRGTTSSRCAS